MTGYTQIVDGRIDEPSLDPTWFDASRGPVIPCQCVMRRPLGIEESVHSTAIVDFAAGERERLERRLAGG